MASSWLKSRDAGLVGRLTVGDDTENKSREGNRKWRKQTFCTIHTHTSVLQWSFSGSVNTHTHTHTHTQRENTHTHSFFYTNTQAEDSHTVCTEIGMPSIFHTYTQTQNMQHNASRAPHTFPLCLTCW